MCDPFTLLTTAASVGGTAVSAAGSLMSGSSTAGALGFDAKIAGANARLLDKEAEIAAGGADLAITRGNYDQFLAGRKVDQTLASEKVHYTSGHVDPTFGSPLFMQGYSAAQGETDMQLIRAGMMKEKADALTTAANIQGGAVAQSGRATADYAKAVAALTAGGIGAGTAFLKGVQKWPGLSGGTQSTTSYSMPLSLNPFTLR